MDRATHLDLLRHARSRTRGAAEAEDLVQDALVVALEAGRADMSQEINRRWLAGVIRNLSLTRARSDARRRGRDAEHHRLRTDTPAAAPGDAAAAVEALPGVLRTTALLALTGHTRAEIAWLLDLSDATLRKRISDIGRRLTGGDAGAAGGGLDGDLPYGLMRRALLARVRGARADLGSHDPDGNLFVASSRKAGTRRQDNV